MDKSARFWDRVADRYAKRPIADEAVYQKKLEVTREYLDPEMEVLEIGCGTGSTAIIHAPFVKHIRAIDVSPKMLEIARRKANDRQIDSISFEITSIDDLIMTDKSLDVVLALSVLHLLGNKEDAIARIYRMLKPGGVFISSTVCLGRSMWWLKIIMPVGNALGWLPSIKFFTSKQLKQSLLDSGLEIEHFWQPNKAHSVFIMSRKPL